jgi:predicted NBD/HSP70 family sugar kinase
MAAAPAIVQMAQEALVRGDPSLLPRDQVPTILDLIEAAKQGDPLSNRIFTQAGRRIGTALTSLVNLLNPGIIVIGGGVARAGSVFMEPLRETVRQRALPIAVQNTRIVESELGPDAIAIGAVTTVLRELFSGPDLAVSVRPHVTRVEETASSSS